jgi:peptide/nickel transport system ATP-binding protein
MTPVLDISGLTVSFLAGKRWTPVVRNLALSVAPRETVALVGESGSGKSVTAMSILRLLPPETSRIEGSILLGGEDVLSLPERDLKRKVRGNAAAMIFQEPMTSLNPVYRVGDQIIEALTCHRPLTRAAAKAEAIRLLDRVRIPNAAARLTEYPHAFSGGMRQRVMIAMALASRPKLLIADEPTTALDVTVQGEILDLIKDLQDEFAMSVLFITHDMGVVAEVADRVVVMLRGEPVEEGPTSVIFTRGRQPYTRALLAGVPRLGSMAGHPNPLRFPIIDIASGEASIPTEVPAAVVGTRPILKVCGLVTRFDARGGLLNRVRARVHAVENVSFDLLPGETLSLVGESGCGKSTTGRSITRLVEPLSGSIHFDGYDVTRLKRGQLRRMRRHIQMIPQDPLASLDPRLTTGEALTEAFVAHSLGTRADAAAKAATLMSRVGLAPAMLRRYPHEFSGGQRQRICVARALMLDPKIIIADESVSALDVSVKAQVVNLLLDIQQSDGIAFLFISHDIAVVERVSHRIAVMYLGEIVEIGPRAAVIENPAHPYTRRLMAAVPVPDPARRALRRPSGATELGSPLRPLGFTPPTRRFREITPGHLVRED